MSLSEKGVNACDRKSSQTQTSTHPKQTKHLENQSHPLLPKGKETFKILVGCGRELLLLVLVKGGKQEQQKTT